MRRGHIERRAFARVCGLTQDGGDRLEQVGQEIRPVLSPHQGAEMAVRRLAQSDECISAL